MEFGPGTLEDRLHEVDTRRDEDVLIEKVLRYAYQYLTGYHERPYYVREPSVDLTTFVPSLPIQRVPACILGYGVLGRCYVGTPLIQIRDDLHSERFENVVVHETKHAIAPHLGEPDVYFWTDELCSHRQEPKDLYTH
jgi:hypothetical protein